MFSVGTCAFKYRCTLNFWIEYLSCNDDLVSKISDHFPNVN